MLGRVVLRCCGVRTVAPCTNRNPVACAKLSVDLIACLLLVLCWCCLRTVAAPPDVMLVRMYFIACDNWFHSVLFSCVAAAVSKLFSATHVLHSEIPQAHVHLELVLPLVKCPISNALWWFQLVFGHAPCWSVVDVMLRALSLKKEKTMLLIARHSTQRV